MTRGSTNFTSRSACKRPPLKALGGQGTGDGQGRGQGAGGGKGGRGEGVRERRREEKGMKVGQDWLRGGITSYNYWEITEGNWRRGIRTRGERRIKEGQERGVSGREKVKGKSKGGEGKVEDEGWRRKGEGKR